jgi:hypothetical protein
MQHPQLLLLLLLLLWPAGRLDFLKQLFLQWEGLLIGGVFVGGLSLTAVRLYINERLDDLAR